MLRKIKIVANKIKWLVIRAEYKFGELANKLF